MRLRPYRPDDAAAIRSWVDSEVTCARWCAGRLPYPFETEEFERLRREGEERWHSACFVATQEDGTPLGCLQMGIQDREDLAFFSFVLLDGKRRGKGYGREMIRLALRYAFEIANVERARIYVFDSNEPAVNCYRRCGFEITEHIPEVFSFRGESWGRYVMEARRGSGSKEGSAARVGWGKPGAEGPRAERKDIVKMKSWEGYQKGVNLGGWLSQCSHTKERYENFITEADFAELSAWGIDHVRVPVDYDLVETDQGEYREEGFAYLQRAIDWCGKYGLNMILDLHKTYGFSFDDGEKEEGFFDNEAYQERFYRLWEQFASRYGRYSPRVAFELLNEVTDPGYCETWNRIADTCVARIRALAPESKILVGGYWNNSAAAVKDIRLTDYTNVVLNFHCYDPILFTHQGAPWVKGMPRDFRCSYPASYADYRAYMEKYLPHTARGFGKGKAEEELLGQSYFEELFADALAEAERREVPLYCGEYGVIDLADAESTVKWYEDIHAVFARHGIGRATWSYRQMNFGLVDPGREELRETIKKNL